MALVSRAFQADNRGRRLSIENNPAGLTPIDLDAMNRWADDNCCDTVVHSGWTVEPGAVWQPRFFELTRLQRVFAELAGYEAESATGWGLMVWERNAPPRLLLQRFIDSSATQEQQAELIADVELGNRTVANALILICGEIYLTSNGRRGDPTGFVSRLKPLSQNCTDTIIHPAHTYMRRENARQLCQSYSGIGFKVVTVWNRPSQGTGRGTDPWTIFQNGTEVTAAFPILPLSQLPSGRTDVVATFVW